jgi:hypothetical protein
MYMELSDAPVAGALLKDLTAAQCLRLSKFLDESVELADRERAAWLDALHLIDPGWAAYIRGMFAAQGPDILDTRGFLASCLPQVREPSWSAGTMAHIGLSRCSVMAAWEASGWLSGSTDCSSGKWR